MRAAEAMTWGAVLSIPCCVEPPAPREEHKLPEMQIFRGQNTYTMITFVQCMLGAASQKPRLYTLLYADAFPYGMLTLEASLEAIMAVEYSFVSHSGSHIC